MDQNGLKQLYYALTFLLCACAAAAVWFMLEPWQVAGFGLICGAGLYFSARTLPEIKDRVRTFAALLIGVVLVVFFLNSPMERTSLPALLRLILLFILANTFSVESHHRMSLVHFVCLFLVVFSSCLSFSAEPLYQLGVFALTLYLVLFLLQITQVTSIVRAEIESRTITNVNVFRRAVFSLVFALIVSVCAWGFYFVIPKLSFRLEQPEPGSSLVDFRQIDNADLSLWLSGEEEPEAKDKYLQISFFQKLFESAEKDRPRVNFFKAPARTIRKKENRDELQTISSRPPEETGTGSAISGKTIEPGENAGADQAADPDLNPQKKPLESASGELLRRKKILENKIAQEVGLYKVFSNFGKSDPLYKERAAEVLERLNRDQEQLAQLEQEIAGLGREKPQPQRFGKSGDFSGQGMDSKDMERSGEIASGSPEQKQLSRIGQELLAKGNSGQIKTQFPGKSRGELSQENGEEAQGGSLQDKELESSGLEPGKLGKEKESGQGEDFPGSSASENKGQVFNSRQEDVAEFEAQGEFVKSAELAGVSEQALPGVPENQGVAQSAPEEMSSFVSESGSKQTAGVKQESADRSAADQPADSERKDVSEQSLGQSSGTGSAERNANSFEMAGHQGDASGDSVQSPDGQTPQGVFEAQGKPQPGKGETGANVKDEIKDSKQDSASDPIPGTISGSQRRFENMERKDQQKNLDQAPDHSQKKNQPISRNSRKDGAGSSQEDLINKSKQSGSENKIPLGTDNPEEKKSGAPHGEEKKLPLESTDPELKKDKPEEKKNPGIDFEKESKIILFFALLLYGIFAIIIIVVGLAILGKLFRDAWIFYIIRRRPGESVILLYRNLLQVFPVLGVDLGAWMAHYEKAEAVVAEHCWARHDFIPLTDAYLALVFGAKPLGAAEARAVWAHYQQLQARMYERADRRTKLALWFKMFSLKFGRSGK